MDLSVDSIWKWLIDIIKRVNKVVYLVDDRIQQTFDDVNMVFEVQHLQEDYQLSVLHVFNRVSKLAFSLDNNALITNLFVLGDVTRIH
jgi:hypothetical protein